MTALIAAVCMLFAQLAMASYACPSMQLAQAIEAAAADAAHLPGCATQHAPAPPCQSHGQAGSPSLHPAELPNVPPMPAILLTQPAHAAAAITAPIQPVAAAYLAHPTAPPMAIRHCCFRI